MPRLRSHCSRFRARRVGGAVALLAVLLLPVACQHGGDSNGGADGGTRTNPNSSAALHLN